MDADMQHLPIVTGHADPYLAAYEWRFKRRFDLTQNLERLTRVALQTLPKPYRSITAIGPAEITG
jgi:hypothetical protein